MNTPSTQNLDFLQKCTAVRVSFGNLSFSKKLPQSAVTTESNPDRISASKKLLDCAEAEAIRGEFTRLRAYIVSRTLPSPFGKGIYFCPNTLMGEIDAELTIASTQTIPRLGEALISVYDSVMVKEREALGPNFAETDYDTPNEIRQRLGIEFSYIVFGIPENLPNAMYRREADKAREKLTECVDTMQALLRSEFSKLIEHAADKLPGRKDGGKRQIFQRLTCQQYSGIPGTLQSQECYLGYRTGGAMRPCQAITGRRGPERPTREGTIAGCTS